MDYEKFIKIVDEKGIDKLKNQYKKEGKEYIIKDGDIVTF